MGNVRACWRMTLLSCPCGICWETDAKVGCFTPHCSAAATALLTSLSPTPIVLRPVARPHSPTLLPSSATSYGGFHSLSTFVGTTSCASKSLPRVGPCPLVRVVAEVLVHPSSCASSRVRACVCVVLQLWPAAPPPSWAPLWARLCSAWRSRRRTTL